MTLATLAGTLIKTNIGEQRHCLFDVWSEYPELSWSELYLVGIQVPGFLSYPGQVKSGPSLSSLRSSYTLLAPLEMQAFVAMRVTGEFHYNQHIIIYKASELMNRSNRVVCSDLGTS